VPPLRERPEDIGLLAAHILRRLGSATEPSRALIRRLESHDWPGNVRELENVLERALILASGELPDERHIQLPEPAAPRREGRQSLWEVEEEMLRRALEQAGGNKARAARTLGITRRMLYTRMKKAGIETGTDEPEGA